MLQAETYAQWLKQTYECDFQDSLLDTANAWNHPNVFDTGVDSSTQQACSLIPVLLDNSGENGDGFVAVEATLNSKQEMQEESMLRGCSEIELASSVCEKI